MNPGKRAKFTDSPGLDMDVLKSVPKRFISYFYIVSQESQHCFYVFVLGVPMGVFRALKMLLTHMSLSELHSNNQSGRLRAGISGQFFGSMLLCVCFESIVLIAPLLSFSLLSTT